ncbi:MAG: phosphoadenylyl-sulfate reductase, partial [Acidobacteria bacterium]
MSLAVPVSEVDDVARRAESWTPQEILDWALDRFHPRISFASSFGVEDVAVIHMLSQLNKDARVFTLDTGRLPAETYDVMERIRDAYGTKI